MSCKTNLVTNTAKWWIASPSEVHTAMITFGQVWFRTSLKQVCSFGQRYSPNDNTANPFHLQWLRRRQITLNVVKLLRIYHARTLRQKSKSKSLWVIAICCVILFQKNHVLEEDDWFLKSHQCLFPCQQQQSGSVLKTCMGRCFQTQLCAFVVVL